MHRYNIYFMLPHLEHNFVNQRSAFKVSATAELEEKPFCHILGVRRHSTRGASCSTERSAVKESKALEFFVFI